jgi:hypothetical protein
LPFAFAGAAVGLAAALAAGLAAGLASVAAAFFGRCFLAAGDAAGLASGDAAGEASVAAAFLPLAFLAFAGDAAGEAAGLGVGVGSAAFTASGAATNAVAMMRVIRERIFYVCSKINPPNARWFRGFWNAANAGNLKRYGEGRDGDRAIKLRSRLADLNALKGSSRRLNVDSFYRTLVVSPSRPSPYRFQFAALHELLINPRPAFPEPGKLGQGAGRRFLRAILL